jgi:tetrahydromethanopterin S-methyltransferase subunit A
MDLKQKLGNAAGKLCEVLIPIKHEYYIGEGNSSIAICTLSSIDLLQTIANNNPDFNRRKIAF